MSVLTQLQDDGLGRVSVYVNRLVLWVWIAGVLIAIGGLVAAWPEGPSGRREPATSPADGRARA